jgi:hypothetical protein
MLKEFADAYSRATDLLTLSVKEATSDDRRRDYQQASDTVATFKSDFDQLVKLSNIVIIGNQNLAKSGVDLVAAVSKAERDRLGGSGAGCGDAGNRGQRAAGLQGNGGDHPEHRRRNPGRKRDRIGVEPSAERRDRALSTVGETARRCR